jgi:hypothetical protein
MNTAKSKIFIAASDRALTLAERLQGGLRTDFCEATVWSERDRRQSGERAIEELDHAAEDFDFAAILLVKDDLVSAGTPENRQSRDNCIFEMGHFAAINGKDRCVLIHGGEQQDLPADLANFESIKLEEPPDLTDGSACANAVAPVVETLKSRVAERGRSASHGRIPLLSTDELFQRERARRDGGNLREDGKVVVCDTQPIADIDVMLQVRRNIDCRTAYHYFLYLTDDCVDKTCQAVQVIVVGGLGGTDIATDFNARVGVVKDRRDDVLRDLEGMRDNRKLRITFLTDEPQFRFRVHNASDPACARVYVRYLDHGFVPWVEGRSAEALWGGLPKWLSDDDPPRIFIQLRAFELQGANWDAFERQLDRAINRYFPGIHDEVKQILIGPSSGVGARS